MPKYVVTVRMSSYHNVTVDADSPEHAVDEVCYDDHGEPSSEETEAVYVSDTAGKVVLDLENGVASAT